MNPDREPVEVRLNWPAKITYDRAPVRFVLIDCFKMAAAVGAGLTCGILAVLSVLMLVHAAVRALIA
ncbi:MAG TPA: hypothetical protein VF695_17195 [Sphingomonas sp.]|jgi:hypothetical protein